MDTVSTCKYTNKSNIWGFYNIEGIHYFNIHIHAYIYIHSD